MKDLEENSINIDAYHTRSQIVYDWLKMKIITGEFAPGQHIGQEMVSSELNVSRTPVRDAFKKLSGEGLLILKPYQSAIVNDLSVETIKEIYEIRSLLEGRCVKVACDNITDEDIEELRAIVKEMEVSKDSQSVFMKLNRKFHARLYKCAQKEYLFNMIFDLWDITEPYRVLYIYGANKSEDSIDEHRKIIKALEQRDSEEACRQIVLHQGKVVTILEKYAKDMHQ